MVSRAFARRRRIRLEKVRPIAKSLAVALTIAVPLLAYPVVQEFAGAHRWKGPVFAVDNPYRADLLGTFVPTSAQIVNTHWATNLSNSFATSVAENGSYLGIPLLILVIICCIKYWRIALIRLAALLAIVAWVLSLGPSLVVKGHVTNIPLPFHLITDIPVLDNLLPVRLSLYVTFFVALVLALSIAAALRRTAFSGSQRRLTAKLAIVLLSGASFAFLIPNWPDAMGTTSATVPLFASSGNDNAIPVGSVVLCFPFPEYPYDQAMLWQAEDSYRWRLVGGYALVPNGTAASAEPPYLVPISVQTFLEYYNWPAWLPDPKASTPPIVNSAFVNALRLYVASNGVTVAMYAPFGRDPQRVLTVFTDAFGQPRRTRGVDIWLLKR